MALRIRNLTLGLDEPEEALVVRAARRLKLAPDQIETYTPVRRSLDARKGREPRFAYDIEVTLAGGPRRERKLASRLRRTDVAVAEEPSSPRLTPGTEPLAQRPIVVGFGPAGMFAALVLSELGYRPVVFERGQDVKLRHAHILRDYYRNGQFDPESNLLFGEGGAGAYSDGKLYTRVNDPRGRLVLDTFVEFGGDPDILIDGRPHLGSDKLPGICRRIRQRIEKVGGEVRFGARVEDFDVSDGVLTAIRVNGERVAAGPVVLGIGHSARDTIRQAAAAGIAVDAKPFQLGLRIEHPQEAVNRWQYGAFCEHPKLPPAEYHVIAKHAAGEHGDVFSFCMCPGGMMLPTHESPGEIATNGASRSGRNGPFANSGLVITIDPREIQDDALAGLAYQEQWERKAFELTGATYRVPAQRAADFLAGRSSDGRLETSYPLGAAWADVREIIPDFVGDALRRALEFLDARMPGFAGPDAILAGPETRASAPVRIVRDPASRESVSARNLYPVGEGAGYAGGIVSAAIDGIKTAETIIARYAPGR
ncbi:MAG: FAD-dependent oxidoreductase [Phycisphaerae bacterium]|nr:FAD-dependent oxidoreductase [Phycisphaerae bacterium]